MKAFHRSRPVNECGVRQYSLGKPRPMVALHVRSRTGWSQLPPSWPVESINTSSEIMHAISPEVCSFGKQTLKGTWFRDTFCSFLCLCIIVFSSWDRDLTKQDISERILSQQFYHHSRKSQHLKMDIEEPQTKSSISASEELRNYLSTDSGYLRLNEVQLRVGWRAMQGSKTNLTTGEQGLEEQKSRPILCQPTP